METILFAIFAWILLLSRDKNLHLENLALRQRAIQFVDRKIKDLNMEIAVLQTSRNTYAKALSEVLNKEEAQ